MNQITITFVPSSHMRYETLGDWKVEENGDLFITVDRDLCETPDHAFLVGLHELVEAKLCIKRGITQAQVDEFDMGTVAKALPDGDEPGDHPDAPYRAQHRQAAIVEHLVANFMGMVGYGEVK